MSVIDARRAGNDGARTFKVRCGAVTIFSLKQVPPNTLNLNPLGDKYKKVRQEGRLWAVEWAFSLSNLGRRNKGA